ncbi:MAG: hypothetical protein NVSMB9_12490 [Isosphaeraceae bacterium]
MIRLSGLTLIRYGGAVLAVALATGTRMALAPILGNTFPFALLLLAVLGIAASAGRGPALVATALGALVLARDLGPLGASLDMRLFPQQIAMLLYLAVGTGIAFLGGGLNSARRRAEKSAGEVLSHQERARITLSSIGDAVISTDVEGRIVSMNPVAETLTGWPEVEAKGQKLEEIFRIVNEATGEPVQAPAARVLREGSIVGLANHASLISRDGTIRPIDDSAAPIRGDGGKVVGVVLIFRDVEERRRAERQLTTSETLHRCIAELTSDYAASARVDEDGRITVDLVTEGFAKVTGYSLAEIEAMGGWACLVHPDELPLVRESLGRMLAGDPAPSEARITTKSGESRWLRYLGRPLLDPTRGRVTRLYLAAQDVTERRRNEALIAEQIRLAEYGRDIGLAISRATSLQELLARCAEVTVLHLDAAFARIWILDDSGKVLTLRASAGMYTHLDGPHARVPLGQFKIGQIAQERSPHLTNSVIGDPRVPAQDWARREGMVSFAGYPLITEDRLVGVLAMFARHALSDVTLQAMSSVANGIAVGIERNHARETLAESEAWLSTTLRSIGDAVIATDVLGCVRFMNPPAEVLTGWTQDEASGRPMEEVFHIVNEQTRALAEHPVARVLREGVVVGLANHTVLIAREGGETPIEDSAAPIRDGQGQVSGVVMVFRDVTEERAAQSLMRESEARKAAILDSALDAIITIDNTGRVLEWNPAAESTFGYERDQALGRALDALVIPPPLREAHRRGLGRFLATGEGPILGRRIEITAVRSDGTEFPVELAITPITTNGPPLFTAHVRDITERKATERRRDTRVAVTETLANAMTLEQAAPDILRAVCEGLGWELGILWIRDEGTEFLRCLQLWHSPSFALGGFQAVCRDHTFAIGVGLPGRVWQSGESAWIPDVLTEVNFPRGTFAAEAGLHGAFASPLKVGERFLGVIEFISARVRKPDLDLLEMMATLGSQLGQFIERRRADEALRAAKEEAESANRAKTQFLAVLSHELRTPLNPILLAATSMLDRPCAPEEIRPTLEMIRQNVNLQARLIDDLLDVMRIVRGKMPLHWEIADCHRLIDQAVQICRSEVSGHDLRLKVEPAARNHHVNADAARLQQVFWNLIKNAVKFTPEGGSIAILTRNEDGPGGRLVVEVSDTGIGIEPEVISRIFDPFQQGETTITRKFGGLGLGLAICKGIVEAHGGTIAVESAGKDLGTTFLVRLEALPQPALEGNGEPRTDAPEARLGPFSPLCILLVEDEPTTLRLMARLLRSLAHQVTTAGTIAAALDALTGNDFDLIVSDIGLPDGTGLDLMRRVIALKGPIPAIALTGYGMEEDIVRSRQAGFTTHMTKPIDFNKLEAMTRQVAARGTDDRRRDGVGGTDVP